MAAVRWPLASASIPRPHRVRHPARSAKKPAALIGKLDLVVDLGMRIGQRHLVARPWTCFAPLLCRLFASHPGFDPLPGAVPAPMAMRSWTRPARWLDRAARLWRRYRPADGRRPTRSSPLTDTPERPTHRTDRHARPGRQFLRAMQRAGVSAAEAARRRRDDQRRGHALAEVKPGTADGADARPPLGPECRPPARALAFRARFDLRIEVRRVDGAIVAQCRFRSRSMKRRCGSRAWSDPASTARRGQLAPRPERSGIICAQSRRK